MADTPNYNLPYPDDYTQLADVPAAVKALAEATDSALEGKADTSDIPDLADYVKNTDYATSSKGGVIKLSDYYGSSKDSNGFLNGKAKTLAEYENSSGSLLISKGTLENVLAAVVGDINSMLDEINGEII